MFLFSLSICLSPRGDCPCYQGTPPPQGRHQFQPFPRLIQACLLGEALHETFSNLFTLGNLVLSGMLAFLVVVLWSGGLGAWLRHLTRREVDVRMWTDCKLYYFMFYLGRHYSSMLLVLMSIEKCFAVYFPLKSKTVCTVKTAKWATGFIGIILAGYNLVHLFLRESVISKSSGRHACGVVGDYKIILDAVDSALYSFGPFVLMFMTNFAIVFKFMTAKCKSTNETESTNQALAKSATRGTAMVVTVSITF